MNHMHRVSYTCGYLGGMVTVYILHALPDSVPDYTMVHPPSQSISDSQEDRPPSSLNDYDDYQDDGAFMEVKTYTYCTNHTCWF